MLDKICLHLPHSCIIIVENISYWIGKREGDFRVPHYTDIFPSNIVYFSRSMDRQGVIDDN
jgi:hypothetical protein